MVGISVEIRDEQVVKLISQLDERASDLSEPLAEVGEYMVSEITQLFRDGKDPYGRGWKTSNRAKREGGKTLVDFGHLRDGTHYAVRGNELRVQNAIEYARVHNEGFEGDVTINAHQRIITQAFGRPIAPVTVQVRSHSKRQKLEKRQFIPTDGLPPDWSDDVTEILQAYLVGEA